MTAALLIAASIGIIWKLLTIQKTIKYNKLIKSMINAAGIILLCEIFVFNAGVFRTALSSAPEKQLNFESAELTNLTYENGQIYAVSPGECIAEFSDIGCPVDTIHFNILTDKGFEQKAVTLNFSDVTRKSLRRKYCSINYISQNERSEYIVCSFSGDVRKLQFVFELGEGESMVIDSINLNEDIPLHISPLRILFLMLLILPVTAVLNSSRRNEKVNLPFLKRISAISAAAFSVIALIIRIYGTAGHGFGKTDALCCLFCIVGLSFLAAAYYALVKKYFGNISNAVAIFGLLTAEITSEIIYCAAAVNPCTLSIAGGFAALTACAYFTFKSNAAETGEISLKHTAAASALSALAALCRPTLSVYCAVLLIFVLFEAKKFRSNGGKLKKYLCFALIPFAAVICAQLAYNAVCFGSPFKFGIQQSFAVNDFKQAQFHILFLFIALYNYLFTAPVLFPEAPFIKGNFTSFDLNGYYLCIADTAAGIFFKALPTLGYTLAGKAYRYCGKNRKAAVLLISSCIIAPLIIIISLWNSGFSAVYAVDFNWEMLFGSYAVLFTVFEKSESLTTKKLITYFFALSVIVAFMTVTSQTFTYLYTFSDPGRHAELLSVIRLFDFFNIF